MLCDYFKPNDATKPVEITYSGNAEIRCGGTVKTFTAKTDKGARNLRDGIELFPDDAGFQ